MSGEEIGTVVNRYQKMYPNKYAEMKACLEIPIGSYNKEFDEANKKYNEAEESLQLFYGKTC